MTNPNLKTGMISSVYTKEGVVRCDVKLIRVQSTQSSVVIPSRFRGEVIKPQEGDKVTIQKTDTGMWILRDVLTVDTEMMSDANNEKSGYTLRFDENTSIEVEKNNSGEYDLILSAGGSVKIREGTDGTNGEESVAVQSHTHDHSWTDGAGSGTTSEPNENGTEVEIE